MTEAVGIPFRPWIQSSDVLEAHGSLVLFDIALVGSSASPWGNRLLSQIILLSVIQEEPPTSAEYSSLPGTSQCVQGEALSPGWSEVLVSHTGNMTTRRGLGLEEQWTVQVL